MPEPRSTGDIWGEINEAHARANEADRKADEADRRAEDLAREAQKKGEEAARKAEEAAAEARRADGQHYGDIFDLSDASGGDSISGGPPSAEPDRELSDQADAAREERDELREDADRAREEAKRLGDELGNAPSDESILDEIDLGMNTRAFVAGVPVEELEKHDAEKAAKRAAAMKPATPSNVTTGGSPATAPPGAKSEPGAGWRHGTTPGGLTPEDAERIERTFTGIPEIAEDRRRMPFAFGLTIAGLALLGWAFTGGRTQGVVPAAPEVQSTPAAATTSPAASTPSTASVQIGGFTITAQHPTTVRAGDRMIVRMRVVDAQNRPAQGTIFATLAPGERTSDPLATHVNGALDQQGERELLLPVNLRPGQATLYTSFNNTVRPLASIPVVASSAASPTAAPTVAATTAAAATAAPTAGTQGDINYPLAGAGLLLTLGGLGFGLGSRKHGLQFSIPYAGGGATQVKEEEEERPRSCDEEKHREASERRFLDAARQRFEEIDRLRAESERAQAEADSAARDAEAAADTRPGEHRDEQGRRARGTAASARAAAEKAASAKGAYDAGGGDAVHGSAREQLREAEERWRKADAALKACLGQ